MSLVEVFLRQGIVGIVCPVAFVTLLVTGLIAGVARTKAAGYTFLAGAWLVAGAFTAFVSRNMFHSSHSEPGVAAMRMFSENLSVIVFFLEPACSLSILAVVVLAAVKFNRRHIAVESLAVGTFVLLVVALRWYIQSIFQAFAR